MRSWNKAAIILAVAAVAFGVLLALWFSRGGFLRPAHAAQAVSGQPPGIQVIAPREDFRIGFAQPHIEGKMLALDFALLEGSGVYVALELYDSAEELCAASRGYIAPGEYLPSLSLSAPPQGVCRLKVIGFSPQDMTSSGSFYIELGELSPS